MPDPAFDARKLQERLDLLRKNLPVVQASLVNWGAQVVKDKVLQFVTGPAIDPKVSGRDDPRIGQIPIPRRRFMLVNSIKKERISASEWTVSSKGSIAPHNVDVHEGLKGIQPRRFIVDSVRDVKDHVLTTWTNTLNKIFQGQPVNPGTNP
jgi:hypothetical protein